MPIIDSSAFADSDALPDRIRCDVCIIGTGPAGMTIARELSGTPLRVTLLESGGQERQEEVDALNEIENVGWPRALDQWTVRNRIMGGSSHTWTGRCAPFDEIDFRARDWVPYSGWPFDLADLTTYIDRSAEYLGLGEGNGVTDERIWTLTGRARPEPRRGCSAQMPDPDKLLPMFWQFSSDPVNRHDRVRFSRLTSNLGSNVTLVTNATALRINATESGAAVDSVDFAATTGRRWSLPTSTVVLCAGGIENARLLLLSDNVAARGLGNDRDVVGRFLMDHPRDTVARFPLTEADAVLHQFGVFKANTPGANTFQRGMRLSPTVQADEQLPNCATWVNQWVSPDDPWESLTNFVRRVPGARPDVRALLRDRRLIMRGLKQYFISHQVMPRKLAQLTLEAMCEQLPNPDSRITLADRRDRFGMRISRIDWRVSAAEARTVKRTTQLMIDQFSRMGLKPPVAEEWVRDGAMFPPTVVDIAHPTGSTRMASDPAQGVVDARCQVHGVHGLFIAGSSVFPTSGHANPTQMIVTLALRLADILRNGAREVAEVTRPPVTDRHNIKYSE